MYTYDIIGSAFAHEDYFRSDYDARLDVYERRQALLMLNRAVAGLLGMDPHYTISTNLARRLARMRKIPFDVAKRWIHAEIAQSIARGFGAIGLHYHPSVDIEHLVFQWLESFDDGRYR